MKALERKRGEKKADNEFRLMPLWIGLKSELTDLLAHLQEKVSEFYTCLFIKIKANLKLIYNAKITSPLTSLNLHTECGSQLYFAAPCICEN